MTVMAIIAVTPLIAVFLVYCVPWLIEIFTCGNMEGGEQF